MSRRRCEKCGGETRACVWNGRRARIMECLTCGFSWAIRKSRSGPTQQKTKSKQERNR